VAQAGSLYTNGHGQHLTAVARILAHGLETRATPPVPQGALAASLTQRDIWVMHGESRHAAIPIHRQAPAFRQID
jgi:hypothetical protein